MPVVYHGRMRRSVLTLGLASLLAGPAAADVILPPRDPADPADTPQPELPQPPAPQPAGCERARRSAAAGTGVALIMGAGALLLLRRRMQGEEA